MNKRSICTALILALVLQLTLQANVVVNKLDNVSANNLVYSGFLPVSDTSSDQLFFTFYGKDGVMSESDLKNSPLLIVVGAPGSSSQFINLAGMGPIILRPDMTTAQNSDSATAVANIMFVDLLGNGFSFVANTSAFPTKSEDYGVQLTYAINAFAKQSVLGQSSVVALAGEGVFIRSLPGLEDIDTISGIIHLSAWPELYAMARYYGVAGMQLKIFGSSQRVAIESTLISCSNYINNKKYSQAHNCYDSVLSFVQSKTKNANLFNVQLGSNLTDHLALIQYYFSLSSTVSLFKAPTTRLFDTQSNWVNTKLYNDLAINKTTLVSQYMKDYLTIKHWYIAGETDFISYKSSVRFWIENELSFVQNKAFKDAKLQDIVIGGETVGIGKQVKQVKYTELANCGHYITHDQPKIFTALLSDWLKSLNFQHSSHITEQQSEYIIAQQ